MPPTPHPWVAALLASFSDVLSKPDTLPPDRAVAHCIDLVPHSHAPHVRLRRYAPPEIACLRSEVASLLAKGFVRPSSSPFGANVLFVGKKDGGRRLCFDFRGLNRITTADKFPLPHMTDMFAHLASAKYFSKIDLVSGFHQILLRPSDCPKTAFLTPDGAYEWVVMPFGLMNAPATFQRLMNLVFRDYMHRFVLAYMDDILVYSNTEVEHRHQLRLVLQRLREHRLFAQAAKCSFFVTTVEYCGHRITEGSVHPVDAKLARIQSWPSPTSLHELRSFLGFAQFYRRFIPNFADLLMPLAYFTRKDVPFVWDVEAEADMQALKAAFLSVGCLTHPDYNLPFVLHTDASDVATGATLSQRSLVDGSLRLLECCSHSLTSAETRYTVHDRELLALVRALRAWRHHLLGADVDVFTDSICVTHLKTQPSLSPRQARWLEFLSQFRLDIRHVAGKHNAAADALSRLPPAGPVRCVPLPAPLPVPAAPQQVERPAMPSAAPVAEPLPQGSHDIAMEDWLPLYRDDPVCRSAFFLPDGSLKPTTRFASGRIWQDSRVVVPDARAMAVIAAFHADGHWGFGKCLDLISRSHVVTRLSTRLRDHVRRCPVCQVTKRGSAESRSSVKRMPLPPSRWHTVHIDWIEGLPSSPTVPFDSILTIVDAATGLTHLVPTRKDSTAVQTARLLLLHVFRLHGLPRVLRSDRDRRVVSHYWVDLCAALGIKPTPTVAFHPRANGAVERVVVVLTSY